AEESVTVLVRSRRSLARHRLEWKPLPTQGNPAPAWEPYFAFDDDEPELADGTQVRIFAVAEEHAPERAPGTVQKFVAADGLSEEVHFGAPGVELRLLGPDGTTVAHQRRFRTEDGFTAFPRRAVAKLNGKGLN